MDSEMNQFLDSFVGAYLERDQSEDFSAWLSRQIRQEMPGLSDGESEKVSREIIEGVAQYDQTLAQLDEAAAAGHSKEEWLAEKLVGACDGMPDAEAGEKLRQIHNEMLSGNAALMGEPSGAVVEEPAGTVEWNEYSLKNEALNIGKQAVMTGLGVAANVIEQNRQNGEPLNTKTVALALKEGASSNEVKAVVAGAIKTATENKLTDALPSDTPVGSICSIAGAAVEGAEAMFDLSAGRCTAAEALDKAGRASVVVASHLCASFLRKAAFGIPVVGPFVAVLANGLFQRMRTPQFTDSVYTVVRSTAVSAWQGIKEKARGVKNFIANKVSNWLFSS